MKSLLGDGYADFIAALERDAVRGARANLIKTDAARVGSLLGNYLTPTDYCDNGFILSDVVKIGHTPEHHAGMIYVQDPGAMATLAAVDIRGDELVLDTCAAPGGKSSQIAERLTTGSLLSNEYVPKRAKIIVGNLERLGVKNAIVTSQDTADIGKAYSRVFDLVVVDAPAPARVCSARAMRHLPNGARKMSLPAPRGRSRYLTMWRARLRAAAGCFTPPAPTRPRKTNMLLITF